MAFTLGRFMPKTTLKLPIIKTYQQPRKGLVIACRDPPRPGGSSGGGPQTNSKEPTSPNDAQIVVKDTADKNKAVKEDGPAKDKSN